ncbi:S-layer homology domain-containing protein, partial [Paenibacillus sp. MCAF20]
ITLHEIKLVDSKLTMSVVTPELVLNVQTTGGFTDVNGHWAEAAILTALERGLVEGYSDGTFRPKKEVTRAEFTAMIVRALQLAPKSGDLTFADKEKIAPWAMPSVQAAADAKLITGYSDQTFRPNLVMTRAEMAVIVNRAFGKKSTTLPSSPFDDASAIPAWAKSSVNEVVSAGIMRGVGHNRFSPNTIVTRAEAITAIMKLLEQKE